MSYSVFVGIDVSAQSVHVVYITSTGEMSEPFVIPQTRSGMDALRNVLLATGYEGAGMLVVMEATGVYWMKLAIYLHGAGFSVSVINPAQAHYFARAVLQRNKTDRIDAQLLAQLAAKLQPAPWQPLSETYEALYQRLTQRDTLFRMLQQERNRLHALKHRPQMVTELQNDSKRTSCFYRPRLLKLMRNSKQCWCKIQPGHAQQTCCAVSRALDRWLPTGCSLPPTTSPLVPRLSRSLHTRV